MADMIDKINVDCQGLTTQVETALHQNADLLKTLKETPNVETITTQVKDTLDKEYELKFKNLEDQQVREKQGQEEIHKDNLNKKVASCRAVFFLVLSYLQCFLVYLLQYLKDTINIIPQTTIRYEILCENRVIQI